MNGYIQGVLHTEDVMQGQEIPVLGIIILGAAAVAAVVSLPVAVSPRSR